MKKVFYTATACALIVFLLCGILVVAFSFYVGADIDYEIDDAMFSGAKSSNTVTYMAYNGERTIKLCTESSGPARSWVSLNDVSVWLKEGFISAEDRRFYSHHGVNLKRTVGAALNYIFHYTSEFGASTITQQVVKNISGDNDHTLRRKAAELLRAFHMEMSHTKDEILEAYMNVIPMSGNIYGVKEASLRYFDKEPGNLTLPEAAAIVGITNAPSRYDPVRCHDACLEKRNKVLYAMLDNGSITKAQYDDAIAQPLEVVSDRRSENGVVSWFVESAREDVLAAMCTKYSISRMAALMLLNSGTRVMLTVDPNVQDVLENFFENEENLSAEFENGLEYSMVVCDSQSGDIVGVIGSGGEKSANRIMDFASIPHPPASALKPLALYAPLIDSGKIGWSTLFDDNPTVNEVRDGELYTYPKNSPDVYQGPITVYDALKSSKNTVAAQMYGMLGTERIYNLLSEGFGFDTLVRERKLGGRLITDMGIAPLAMGQLSDGVSLKCLTSAYTVFPGGGVLRGGRTYYGVFGEDGEVILDNSHNEKRIFKSSTAALMNMMLSGVVESGTARSITLKESVDTAAKTGTSSGNLDKLLVGYTPYYTAGIWCGYRDRANGVYAQHPNHIEIWDSVMRKLHEKNVFNTSEELVAGFDVSELSAIEYCRSSGMLATPGCACEGTSEWGYFVKGAEPVGECPLHFSEE